MLQDSLNYSVIYVCQTMLHPQNIILMLLGEEHEHNDSLKGWTTNLVSRHSKNDGHNRRYM